MNYFFLGLIMLQALSFKETQLGHSRVKTAYEQKEGIVQNYFKHKNLDFENFQLFIRAFKNEKILEVWIKEKNADQFTLASHIRILHELRFARAPKEGKAICKS
jgi:hypothetical protein